MSETYSYSKLSCFKQCNYLYFLKYVKKLKAPFSNSPALEKGSFIHYLLENYPNVGVEYKLTFPNVLTKEQEYRNFVVQLVTETEKIKFLYREDVLYAREQQFYLDKNLNIVETKEESLFNGVIDYVGLYNKAVILVDWKTGQSQNLASLDQLEFYTMWAFKKFPEADRVICFLMFVEQGKFKQITVHRSKLEELQTKYLSMIGHIETMTEFKKNRNDKCGYCAFLTECNKINLKRN